MPNLDLDEITKLLQIVEKIPSVLPGATHISAECRARLVKINSGLEEEKRADQPPISNLSGMPVTPNVPSQPIEDPKSAAAADAKFQSEPAPEDLRPVDPTPANASPRAIPTPADEPSPGEPSTPEIRKL